MATRDILTGAIPGTAVAGKVVVADAGLNLGSFNSVTITDLSATDATLTAASIADLDATFKGASATGTVIARFGGTTGEGVEWVAYEEDITCDGSAAYDLSADWTGIPVAVQANLETIVTATTAVKVGIGVAGDEDKYGKTSALTKNAKIDTQPARTAVSAEDVQVFACDTAGDDAGTLDTGTIRVRYIIERLNSLDDAP